MVLTFSTWDEEEQDHYMKRRDIVDAIKKRSGWKPGQTPPQAQRAVAQERMVRGDNITRR